MRVILFGVVGGGESLCKHSVGVWEEWENVGGVGELGGMKAIRSGYMWEEVNGFCIF